MIDYFPQACVIEFGDEGPYSDSPSDPGGETKWGIARNEHPEITDEQWAAWSQVDSRNMLREQYWDKYQCGSMPWPWALAIFDAVVNQGGSMIAIAQMALHTRTDGLIGPGTLAAIRNASRENLAMFLAYRCISYVGDKGFHTNGTGWFKRVVEIAMEAAVTPAET